MRHVAPPCQSNKSALLAALLICLLSPLTRNRPPHRRSFRSGKKAHPVSSRGAMNPSSTRTGGTRTSTIHRSPCSCRAAGQGQWHRGHRRRRRRSSRAGVQSRRRRARAISGQPRGHGLRAEVPAVPRARFEVHHREHRRGHPPRHAHGAGPRRRVAHRSGAHRRHGLVGRWRGRGAGRLSTRRRRREVEGSHRARQRAAGFRDPGLSRAARHSRQDSRRRAAAVPAGRGRR